MATTPKKAAKKSKPKPHAASSADSVSELKQTIAARAREIGEGAEQQAATSDILKMIARAGGFPVRDGCYCQERSASV